MRARRSYTGSRLALIPRAQWRDDTRVARRKCFPRFACMRERLLNRTTLDVLLVVLLIVWSIQPTLF
jgi:hypothetical protein